MWNIQFYIRFFELEAKRELSIVVLGAISYQIIVCYYSVFLQHL